LFRIPELQKSDKTVGFDDFSCRVQPQIRDKPLGFFGQKVLGKSPVPTPQVRTSYRIIAFNIG